MHFNFDFNTVQILWTLTFAAQLVLLVVLLGRERTRRFPWFATSIVIIALRLLASRLLYTRMQPLPFKAILITLSDLEAVIGLMVLLEIARRAFGSVSRRAWSTWSLILVAIAGGVLAVWGAWPSWKTLTADSSLAVLLFMQLVGLKGELLVSVLTLLLGAVVVLFGRRYQAGWRSHTQQIAVGLSTAAAAQIAVQAVWQVIATKAHPQSMEEYQRVVALRNRIFNANSVVYIAVLVWWIACLWIDEPGGSAAVDETAEPAPQTEETPQGDLSLEAREAREEPGAPAEA